MNNILCFLKIKKFINIFLTKNTMTLPPVLSSTYTIIEEIVRLTSRNVILLLNSITKEKVIAYKYSSLSELEKNEIRYLALSPQYHPNLLACQSIILDNTNNNTYYCLVDYAPSNTLYHYIIARKPNETLDESIIWNFLIQMLYAIFTLHSNGIIHNNIKLSNFFMFNNNTTIKLGGYKLCESINDKNSMKNLASSLNYFYASPELINKTTYDTNSDIWSIGVCIYELCFPRNEYNQLEMYLSLLQGNIKSIDTEKYSKELFDVIKLMLDINITKRPNTINLLNSKVIMKHIYDITQYLDVMSLGMGIIEEIPPLCELNNLIEEFNKKKRKNLNLNSNFSQFVSYSLKDIRQHKGNNTSRSKNNSSICSFAEINNKHTHKKSSDSNMMKSAGEFNTSNKEKKLLKNYKVNINISTKNLVYPINNNLRSVSSRYIENCKNNNSNNIKKNKIDGKEHIKNRENIVNNINNISNNESKIEGMNINNINVMKEEKELNLMFKNLTKRKKEKKCPYKMEHCDIFNDEITNYTHIDKNRNINKRKAKSVKKNNSKNVTTFSKSENHNKDTSKCKTTHNFQSMSDFDFKEVQGGINNVIFASPIHIHFNKCLSNPVAN